MRQTMISVIEDLLEFEEKEIIVAKLVSRNTYVYPALKPIKDKELSKSEGEGKEGYSFDITKADQIYELLLKDR